MNIKNLDDPEDIHAFNAKLAGAMDAYDTDIVLDKKAEMTPEENKSAIARNAHSAQVAENHLEAA